MKKALFGLLTALMIVMLLIVFVGCEKSNGGDSPQAAYDESVSYSSSDGLAYRKSASAGNSVQKVILTTDRMMVYTVDLALTVEDYAATAATIRSALAEAGGYEQSSSTTNYGRYTFTLRVPTEKLNAFLHTVGESGTVESQTVTGEDITDRYLSAEEERDALLAKKAALEALADEATTFTDKVTIYEKIQDVAAEIDRYNDRLSDYKKASDYSTVTVTLYEEGTYEEPTFWDRLGEIFLDSGRSIGTLFGGILKAIVAIIPYAVLLGAIFGVFCLIRLIICRKKKVPFYLFRSKERRAEREAKTQAALKALGENTAAEPMESEKTNKEKEEK